VVSLLRIPCFRLDLKLTVGSLG